MAERCYSNFCLSSFLLGTLLLSGIQQPSWKKLKRRGKCSGMNVNVLRKKKMAALVCWIDTSNPLPPDIPFSEEESRPYLTNLILSGILLVAAEHALNCYCPSENSFHLLHKWGSAGGGENEPGREACSSYSFEAGLLCSLTAGHQTGNLISLTLKWYPPLPVKREWQCPRKSFIESPKTFQSLLGDSDGCW